MNSNPDIKDIFEKLNAATEKETKSMSEGAFKEIFLPMFLGEESKHGMKMANWINYAGGPFFSVKVVDDKGAVLFTVPPVYNRKALDDLGGLDAGGRPMRPISHILTTYGQMARIGPNVGENYINAELTKRFDVMKKDVDFLATLKVWKDIFTRYGHGDRIHMPGDPPPKTNGHALPGIEGDYQDEIVDL